ncbi:calcium ATPase [Tuber magnatum]|uniref:Calcium ATPase n=1 Tax=Tuber magnatum TaxID=42249 RepID=A0A317SI10_9PEZI|nr:calcium ATPase [Tuber magnatum]
MAVGTKIMVGRNVIVRKLDSLEALGAVTNICSDKTGTLTQGKMVVKRAWVIAEGTYSVGDSNNPVDPTSAEISFESNPPFDDTPPKVPKTQAQRQAESPWLPASEFSGKTFFTQYLNVATFCNLATVHRNRETEHWDTRGDPTEIAIQVFASRFDWGRRKFTSGDDPSWTELAEYPFDSDVKRMTVIYRNLRSDREKGCADWAFMKGAVERVLEACATIQYADGAVPLSAGQEEKVMRNMEELASQGLRVLALAKRPWNFQTEDWGHLPRGDVERDMTLLGLIGLYDPPRVETAGAVKACHKAGINVHMLTGDHKQTARAIAIEVGILPPRANQLAPDTKVRMVEALHRRKKFVAMTGDGVNDSPALKRADVGIGMGMAGSDVAKDASDIVLTDDNFASILNSIEEGRRMFDNIKKFVLHLLAENIAQACTLLIGLAFKDSTGLSVFPLAPVEILWIIMITSSFPDMGLGWEPASDDVMTRPPHNLKVGIFTTELLVDLTVYGFWMAALCLASFELVVFGFGDGNLGHNCNHSIDDGCELVYRARSTTFTCLTWFALFLAWEMVHMRRSFFRLESNPPHIWTMWARHAWRNPFLFWSIMAGFITVFPIIYVPGLNTVVFKHAPISWEWGIVIAEALLFFLGIEFWKLCKRVYFRRHGDKVRNPETELGASTFSRYASTAGSGVTDGGVDVEAQT